MGVCEGRDWSCNVIDGGGLRISFKESNEIVEGILENCWKYIIMKDDSKDLYS